jgi:hypothetical protein
MSRFAILLAIGVVLVADGYLCGRWSGRWNPVDRSATGEKVKQLPMACGDWRSDQPTEIDSRTVQRAGFSGYEQRIYRNANDPRALPVCVLVAWGPAGPLSVHSPEVCYGAAGYTMGGQATVITPHDAAGSSLGEFFNSTFVSQDSTSPRKLRVIWSWNKQGAWHAPGYPRWSLAGTPVLYKLYVSQEFLPGGDDASAKEGKDIEAFLQTFLPEVNAAIAPGS